VALTLMRACALLRAGSKDGRWYDPGSRPFEGGAGAGPSGVQVKQEANGWVCHGVWRCSATAASLPLLRVVESHP
jgi:hypothetical protein